jgi:hypothetical protein
VIDALDAICCHCSCTWIYDGQGVVIMPTERKKRELAAERLTNPELFKKPAEEF